MCMSVGTRGAAALNPNSSKRTWCPDLYFLLPLFIIRNPGSFERWLIQELGEKQDDFRTTCDRKQRIMRDAKRIQWKTWRGSIGQLRNYLSLKIREVTAYDPLNMAVSFQCMTKSTTNKKKKTVSEEGDVYTFKLPPQANNYYLQKYKRNFTVRNPGWHYLSQVIKVSIIIDGTN